MREGDMINKLRDVDVIGAIRGFENNEVTGGHLYRVLRTAGKVYGLGYVANIGRDMIDNPQNPRFGLKANRPMVARYWMIYAKKLYQVTHKPELLDFIAGFLGNSDERIRREAQKSLEKIGIEDTMKGDLKPITVCRKCKAVKIEGNQVREGVELGVGVESRLTEQDHPEIHRKYMEIYEGRENMINWDYCMVCNPQAVNRVSGGENDRHMG